MAFCKPDATPVGEVAAPTVVAVNPAGSIAIPNTVAPDTANAVAAPNAIGAIAAATIPDLCDGE